MKYHSKKVTIDGHTFDSKKEASRYLILKQKAEAGAITNLKLQPRYELQPKYKKNNKTIRKIEYVADFEYEQNGKTKVEDVKGYKTEAYKLKKKIFEYKYQELEIEEIK